MILISNANPARERRAKWALNNLNLSVDSKILNIGCGDGLLDIWLSRLGMSMTSIDRNSKVLELDQQSNDTKKVNFISLDFRQLSLKEVSLDTALFLEAVGLVSKKVDQILFNKISKWLKPGAKFIVDCPEKVEIENSLTKKFPLGEIFSLLDPTEPIRNSGSGIARYIYSKDELSQMLNWAGFEIIEVPHYYEKDYFSLVGTKSRGL